MKRICVFCECWESGGIESFLNNVLLHMDLTNMEVDIVAACLKSSIFTSGLERKGIHFIELSGKLRSMENHHLFRKLLRERKYDLVHFNLFQGLSLHYVQIAKSEGIPVRIVHSHGAGLRDSRTKQLKLVLHGIGRQIWRSSATDYWACSRQAADFLFGKVSASVWIVPNGIEIGHFRFSSEIRRQVREELGISDQLLIGTVGRFSQEKNQSFLLDAFSYLTSSCPDSRLLLVGSGDDEAKLRRKAEDLDITGRVIFYGTSSRVERLLSAMDIFVFPSLVEGLGIACVEAQASGLPVLCSENIPDEAKITPLVKTLELKHGAQHWAEALSTMPYGQPRRNGALLVRKAGFDISDVALSVRRRYMELSNDGS